MLLAEAGLSECARDAACSANFNRPFNVAGLVVLLAVWIYSSVFATVLLERTGLKASSRRRWIAVIWLAPFIGSAVWFWVDAVARADQRTRSERCDH